MTDDPKRAVRVLLFGELGASKFELQDAIWHGDDGLEPILDRAVKVVVEAGKPAHADDQFRPCVHEDLLLVYQMVDLPGYARQIEEVASRFADEIATSSQCHFCMATLHVQALLGQRRYADADRLAIGYIATLPSPDPKQWWYSRWLDLVCLRADIAAARGAHDTLREVVAVLRGALPDVPSDNTVLRATMRRGELQLAIAEGDAASAAASYAAVTEGIQASADVVLGARVMYATYLGAAGRWRESREISEPGIAIARARNAYRWEAELCMLALQGCKALGVAAPAERVRELEVVIGKLHSGDLDDVARSLGARISPR